MKIREGTQGMIADFAAIRVVAVRDGLPGPEGWLVLRRNCLTHELKTYLSNAPIRTPFETLVRMSGMRWPIETTFKDCKQYLGMGDYEVRTWPGWHHHMTLCILAHFFLIRVQVRTLEILGYRQKRNYLAYLSHGKKRERLLNQSP